MGKLSSYAAQTAPAGGDLTVEVDISDTTMASSGTDKKMTLATLGAFLTGWHDLVRDFGADPTGSTSIATPLANACTAAVAAQPAPYALTAFVVVKLVVVVPTRLAWLTVVLPE